MSYEDYYRGYEVGYNEAKREFSQLLYLYKQHIEFLNMAVLELKTNEILNNDPMSVLPADDTKKNS